VHNLTRNRFLFFGYRAPDGGLQKVWRVAQVCCRMRGAPQTQRASCAAAASASAARERSQAVKKKITKKNTKNCCGAPQTQRAFCAAAAGASAARQRRTADFFSIYFQLMKKKRNCVAAPCWKRVRLALHCSSTRECSTRECSASAPEI
jgi:hypothetical protein